MHRFPLPIWIILAGTLFFGLSYFMTWPFLAIVLKRDFGMNPTEIGAVLSLAAFVGAGASLISGNLSDRLGRKAIILIANAVLALAFVIMATADSAFWIITGAVLVISMRHIADPPRRALITDLTSDKDTRELAFHLNYFMVNVGATTGPFIALFFGISARQSTFWVSAVVLGVYTLALVLALWRGPNRHVGGAQTSWGGGGRGLAGGWGFRRMDVGSRLVCSHFG